MKIRAVTRRRALGLVAAAPLLDKSALCAQSLDESGFVRIGGIEQPRCAYRRCVAPRMHCGQHWQLLFALWTDLILERGCT